MYSGIHKSETNIVDLKSNLNLEINKMLGFWNILFIYLFIVDFLHLVTLAIWDLLLMHIQTFCCDLNEFKFI